MSQWVWWAAAGLALLVLILFRRLWGAAGRLAARSGLGLVLLWLLQGVGGLAGIQLGVNLLNGLILGLLGAPGFALLLMAQWVVR